MASEDEGTRVSFGLLGPVSASRDGEELPLGGRRQRALLAMLLLSANEVVARDRLVDGLWGEDAPVTAANALQVAIYGLRRALGAGRIETHGAGYRLRVEPGELDLHRFEQLVRQAGGQEPAAAAASLGEALALWRGTALADVAEAPFAPPATARLEEQRLQAVELRLEAQLALGQGPALIAPLEELTALHPYRERLRGQLMLALYHAGRQAEALEAYAEARRVLAEELGIDPSPELRELERAILRQEPSLSGAVVIAEAPAPFGVRLPVAAGPLVGRRLELAAMTALLREERVRLLTLTGPGGTGKTRLALELAGHVAPDFLGGVVFVDLAPLRDPSLVVPQVADSIEAPEQTLDAIRGRIGDRRVLLVLDNFEHVTAAAGAVPELLAAPELVLLVTSRERLRLSAERAYPVPPLPLPTPGAGYESVAASDAVRFFAARAAAVDPSFGLTAENARAVADLCVALDGLPLALELAAARTALLPVEELGRRLGQRLPLLSGGARDLPARQQALRSTIEWSYDLLGEAEQRLFRSLAVFAGGCTVDDAGSVCGEVGVVEGLASLVDKSLLRRRDAPSGGRLRMLETVREYALERLERAGETQAASLAHARHFAALAEEGSHALYEQAWEAAWADRLAAEADNMRAALAWTAEQGELELELRIAGALWIFWLVRGHLSEGRRWLEAALERADRGDPTTTLAAALAGAAHLAFRQGDLRRAAELDEQALAVYRALDDPVGTARMLGELGNVAIAEKDHERALELYEQAGAVFREHGERARVARVLQNMASIANMGGDYARGRELAEEALALQREVGQIEDMSITLHNMARIELRLERLGAARELFGQSLDLAEQTGYRELVAYCLEGLGELAATLGDAPAAARLIGAAEGLFAELAIPMQDDERDSCAATLTTLAETLGPEELAAGLAGGRALDEEAARQLARAVPVPG